MPVRPASPLSGSNRRYGRKCRRSCADVGGVSEIPGATHFLSALPADRWAIVTSAPRKLAERRLRAAGVPLPKVLVTAEDVQRGKPDPSCFLTAAQQLGAAQSSAWCLKTHLPG
ncbi:HAD family hydrolase [Sphingomonas sp. DT-51]|uniref:HAD family hydrolase n=1 Tax=Sphingomonas sp. DT-51 TaxID=3396165 RepID=UPI003F1A5FAC